MGIQVAKNYYTYSKHNLTTGREIWVNSDHVEAVVTAEEARLLAAELIRVAESVQQDREAYLVEIALPTEDGYYMLGKELWELRGGQWYSHSPYHSPHNEPFYDQDWVKRWIAKDSNDVHRLVEEK